MNESMNDREFIAWFRNLDNDRTASDWKRMIGIAGSGALCTLTDLYSIASLRLDLADRDKQVAELSVSGGELIERWHTALDQRDEARETLAVTEGRIAEARLLAVSEVSCWCRECTPYPTHMIVCPDCGNKRCPRATNHHNP